VSKVNRIAFAQGCLRDTGILTMKLSTKGRYAMIALVDLALAGP